MGNGCGDLLGRRGKCGGRWRVLDGEIGRGRMGEGVNINLMG